ncbi:alpha/beta hydrolase family protein [Actinomadura macrotermitis]|uniref:Lipase n=1 Tax=Actinomadura macrotermitis TaxID=2585200 RepID=A0A7K0C1Y1_9ACTN|nr:lipase [Actinomadura macrotermitis]MQY07473.1 hypothetical protein [Actinomadura macrotermitis]
MPVLRRVTVMATALALLPVAPASAAPRPPALRPPALRPPARALTMTLPAPTGRYPVGTLPLRLVDRSRHDSLRPSRPYRELMVSLWYPARGPREGPAAPQMPARAAADFDRNTASDLGIAPGRVDWAATRTHARTAVPARRGRRPVIVYSPGLDGPRTLGTVLVEDLASRGYVVVAVDHTYQPDQVEFPGGRVERGRLPDDPTEEEFDALVKTLFATRRADIGFVLDRLARIDRGAAAAATPLGRARLAGTMDLSRVGVFGHSFGGAAAAQTVHDDPRVDAGANLDGRLVGPVVATGVTKPFLQVAGETTTRETEPSWRDFRAHSTGWKREVRIAGTRHLSFMDLQAMLPQLARRLPGLPLADLVGTIDPARSVAVQRACLAAFFDLHLRGRPTAAFDRPDPATPEVTPIP